MKYFILWFILPSYLASWNFTEGFFAQRYYRHNAWETIPERRKSTDTTMEFRRNAAFQPKNPPVLTSGRKYPLSRQYYDKYMKRVQQSARQPSTEQHAQSGNKRNSSRSTDSWLLNLLNLEDTDEDFEFDLETDYDELFGNMTNGGGSKSSSAKRSPGLHIIINTGENDLEITPADLNGEPNNMNSENETPLRKFQRYQQQLGGKESRQRKSEHYEVIRDSGIKFADIGGYESVKRELHQCIDILKNHTKYSRYNVRVPKGLIFEGPPGTGKTLLAKALAGEADTAFIAVSGSEFQEKYVGVGPMRVRELFALAKNNKPCIVFIDEIDALGRKRSSEGEASSERDNTLNELLVSLDGFKNTSGIFVVGATNRIDLLDTALIRPGRIDKRIHIGYPDAATRKAILAIHTRGKPCDISVSIDDLVEITAGMSGAQIENLVNEALLNALRENREYFTNGDIEIIMNKILAGWQPIDHQFNDGLIHQIAIHEMGHSIVGLLSKHHSKMRKVIINLSSPTSPAYTVFEATTTSISTREALFEHLMILLAGRIAEEIFFEASVSTGAINDFEEALKLAERMILYFGMGKEVIYPSRSEKYKEIIDVEIADLLNSAYDYAEFILKQSKDLILEGAEMLKRDKLINANTLVALMENKYRHILDLKIQH